MPFPVSTATAASTPDAMFGSAWSSSASLATSRSSVTGMPSMASGTNASRVGSIVIGDASSGGVGLGGGPKVAGSAVTRGPDDEGGADPSGPEVETGNGAASQPASSATAKILGILRR